MYSLDELVSGFLILFDMPLFKQKFHLDLENQKMTYRWVPLKPDFLGAWKSVWLKRNPAYPIIIA